MVQRDNPIQHGPEPTDRTSPSTYAVPDESHLNNHDDDTLAGGCDVCSGTDVDSEDESIFGELGVEEYLGLTEFENENELLVAAITGETQSIRFVFCTGVKDNSVLAVSSRSARFVPGACDESLL